MICDVNDTGVVLAAVLLVAICRHPTYLLAIVWLLHHNIIVKHMYLLIELLTVSPTAIDWVY